MSARRPYIYQDREWLEIAQIQEKQDVFSDEIPLSEFDQPYRFNNLDDDTYPTYEYDYSIPPYPGPGPGPDPVPIPGPCNAKDGCGFVTIISVPDEIECEDEYWFRTIHEVHGCNPANFEDAFLVWSLHGPGELTPTGVGAIYKAPKNNDGAEVTVCVSSIDGSCHSCRTFRIKCAACCEEFEIVGPDTANPGTTWGGAITPPCPGAECTVTNNSGCPMTCAVNPDGSSVTVGVGAKNCGSFTVTVTENTSTPQKQEDNCPGESASKTVRINGNGGAWQLCGGGSYFLCNGPFCHCEFEDGEKRWFIWIGAGIFCGSCFTWTCWDNYYQRPPLGNVVYTKHICASACPDSLVPCAGGSLFGATLFYWVNPDCECL